MAAIMKRDPPLPPGTKLRLMVKTSSGKWVTVLNCTTETKDMAAAWARLANKFLEPTLQWQFQETSGRFVRDELYAEGQGATLID